MQFANKKTVFLVTDDRKYHFSVITAESSKRGIFFRFKVFHVCFIKSEKV